MTFNIGDRVRITRDWTVSNVDSDGDVYIDALDDFDFFHPTDLELVSAAHDDIGSIRVDSSGTRYVRTGRNHWPWIRLSDGHSFSDDTAASWTLETPEPTEWRDSDGDVWVPNPKNLFLWLLRANMFGASVTADTGLSLADVKAQWG